jgi:hypothetical protein
MRPFLLFAAALLLAGQAPGARADTMYKCVDAKGKIAYSNLACPGLAKAAREFEVAAPESAEDSAVRLGAERARLRKEEAAFKKRQAGRNAVLDDKLRQSEIVRRRQEQADLDASRRQEAQQMQQRGEAGRRKAVEAARH